MPRPRPPWARSCWPRSGPREGRHMPGLTVLAVEGLPEVRPGDVLADLIAERVRLSDFDVVVVTQKVVSKAEGRLVEVDPQDPLSHKATVEEEAVRVLRRRGGPPGDRAAPRLGGAHPRRRPFDAP